MEIELMTIFEGAKALSSYLKDYISYYKTLVAPGYAVLITGEWGLAKPIKSRSVFQRTSCIS